MGVCFAELSLLTSYLYRAVEIPDQFQVLGRSTTLITARLPELKQGYFGCAFSYHQFFSPLFLLRLHFCPQAA